MGQQVGVVALGDDGDLIVFVGAAFLVWWAVGVRWSMFFFDGVAFL